MKPLLLICPLLFNIALAQYKLALNLQSGTTYSLAVHSDARFSGIVNGQKTAVSVMMSGVMKFKVISSTDSDYTLSASFDSLKFAMKSPLGKMEFDAGDSSSDDGQVSSIAKQMRDKQVHVTLFKNGSIRKVKDPDTAGLSAMMKRLPMLDMLKRMMMAKNSNRHFSHRMMKENFEKLTALFPDKKVALNETWGSVIRMDSAGSHQVKITNQLVAYENGFATIKGHRESIDGNSPAENNRKGTHITMKGETSSLSKVNVATGWVSDATMKTTISGQSQRHGQSGETDSFTITINTQVTGY